LRIGWTIFKVKIEDQAEDLCEKADSDSPTAVIGDTVNFASRYCDGAGLCEIVISKSLYEHVYRFVKVSPKTIRTKHPDVEPDLDGYLVEGLCFTQK